MNLLHGCQVVWAAGVCASVEAVAFPRQHRPRGDRNSRINVLRCPLLPPAAAVFGDRLTRRGARGWLTAGTSVAAAPLVAASFLVDDLRLSFATLLVGYALRWAGALGSAGFRRRPSVQQSVQPLSFNCSFSCAPPSCSAHTPVHLICALHHTPQQATPSSTPPPHATLQRVLARPRRRHGEGGVPARAGRHRLGAAPVRARRGGLAGPPGHRLPHRACERVLSCLASPVLGCRMGTGGALRALPVCARAQGPSQVAFVAAIHAWRSDRAAASRLSLRRLASNWPCC